GVAVPARTDRLAVGAGEGEVALDVAGDDLGGEAVKPLASRVAGESMGTATSSEEGSPRASQKRRVSRSPKGAATATSNPGISIHETPSRDGFLGIVGLRWVS